MPPPPLVIHHVGPDADELQDVARVWSLDFRPMTRTCGVNELLQTIDSTTMLGYVHTAPQISQRGVSPVGMRSFALIGRRSPDIVWCGMPAGADTLLCFDAGGGFESWSPPGFEVHTLSVDVEHLDALAVNLGVGSVDELESGACVIPLEPSRAEVLRARFERATRAVVDDGSAMRGAAVRETLEVDLPAAMLRAALPRRRPSPRVGADLRGRALRRALDFIEANAARAPRVSELCAVVGASERTLRYAFQDRFGMSPKACLQAVRLNGVRRELRRSADRAMIVDTANRWGFWHMGQLAVDYRRLFGELPSETVPAQRGRASTVSVRRPSSAQRRL
jgi:AraC family ethanolamine operon transcriptional activator